MYARFYNIQKKSHVFSFAARKVFSSILFIFRLLCPFLFFSPLTGLYWNKSLVTHTAAFLWVSQANFDTLIMISLSLWPFPLPHTNFLSVEALTSLLP